MSSAARTANAASTGRGKKTANPTVATTSQPLPEKTALDGSTTSSTSDGTTNYFPHLPPYTPPTTGLVSRLPRSWVPYAELMRLDRPAGFYAFYVPYLIGLGYAACAAESSTDSPPPAPATLLRLAALLVPFNVLLRGAACAWNDTVDRDFDRRVARTRHRPVARGAVSPVRAHAFTLAQLAVLGAPFYLVPGSDPSSETQGQRQDNWWWFPRACAPHAAAAAVLLLAYALMKRVTHYPQVVLGIPFAWAVFFCDAALGGGGTATASVTRPATVALFVALVLWTITYDTVYAHQDVEDDVKAGVKGMAVRFRHSTKLLASVLSVAQVGLLALCGVWAGFGPLYFVGTVGGVAAALAYFIYDVDLKRPESCGAWFYRQFWLVGGAFVAGFVGEYIARLRSWEHRTI